MTVLVVEANQGSAYELACLLQVMGHKVLVAADGDAAWSLLQHQRVDLVFSDWMLPGMDGQGLCRRIRAQTGRPYIYVIGVTAQGAPDDRLESLAAGADDFLTKPFDPRELVARLEIANRLLAMHKVLEEKNDALRALATTDELTGLKNRRRFFDDLGSHFAHPTRERSPLPPGKPAQAVRERSLLSLIILDVDEFKSYNDAFGHPAGDDVLRGIADVLRDGTRDYDTVARHGGEEFAILLPETPADIALGMAERLREAVETHPWSHRPVTASFGVATMNPGAGEARDLVDQADAALYVSKHNGRNRVTQSATLGCARAGIRSAAGTPAAVQVPGPSSRGPSGLAPTCEDFVAAWGRAISLRDSETSDHSLRVTEMVLALARALGIDEAEMPHIRRGALLHDIGKIGIPDSILHKPGPLTEEEWVVMRRHPEYARALLAPIPSLASALEIPCAHHERWDGSGYPAGLKGDQIPLSARAFAAVDVWDALSHDRPYRKAWPPEQVNAHVASLAGTHLDPRVVEVLQQTLATQAALI